MKRIISYLFLAVVLLILAVTYFSLEEEPVQDSNMEKWNTIPAYAEPYLKSTEYTDAPLPDNTLRVSLSLEEAAAIKRLK